MMGTETSEMDELLKKNMSRRSAFTHYCSERWGECCGRIVTFVILFVTKRVDRLCPGRAQGLRTDG